MSTPAQTRADTARKQTGGRLAALGGVLFVIGLVLLLLDVAGLGLVFMSFSAILTLAGVALLLITGTAERAEEGKPFA
jgi:hypothetical protein